MDAASWIGTLVPFAGTILGSAFVFFLKSGMARRTEAILSGFAAGVMVAASFFSLLLPGMESCSWQAAALSFLAGIFFLLLLDLLIPHIHPVDEQEEGPPATWKKTTKLFLAMTLHNIPEGMSVGLVFACVQDGFSFTLASAAALAIGIAIQNVPEGAVISMPLHQQGFSRWKAFVYGTLSGVVEPIGTLAGIAFAPYLSAFLPWLLCFCAGAMLYVCVEELIPESQTQSHSNFGTIAFAIGFAAMMILDTALG